jgi:hypothetical protein
MNYHKASQTSANSLQGVWNLEHQESLQDFLIEVSSRRISYRSGVRKTQGKGQLRVSRYRLNDNIKIDIREIFCADMH